MKRVVSVLLCLLLLLGCQIADLKTGSQANVAESLQQNEETSQTPAYSSQSSEAATSDVVDIPLSSKALGLPPIETLEVYRFWRNGNIYSHSQIEFEGEQTLLTAINLSTSSLPYVYAPLPIVGATMQKSFITLDFSEDFINIYSKEEIYEILNTISMTLLSNSIADSFCFTLAGDTGVFGEVWDIAPLVVEEADPEEFAAIRAAIAYPGLEECYYPDAKELLTRFGVDMDENAWEIGKLLARVGVIEHDVASPQELEPFRTFLHCVWSTQCFYSDNADSGENYEPNLYPIADSVSSKLGIRENMFWLEEHIRQTAKLLFGDDYVIDLSQGEDSKYKYFPLEGVVTPPHMGGGYNTIALVLSYEEIDDGYRAEVVYLFESMGGIGPWSESLSPQELPDYVANRAERSEVIVRRAEDGRLCFVSHRIL